MRMCSELVNRVCAVYLDFSATKVVLPSLLRPKAEVARCPAWGKSANQVVRRETGHTHKHTTRTSRRWGGVCCGVLRSAVRSDPLNTPTRQTQPQL